MLSLADDTTKRKPEIGHNLPTAREWLHAVLYSGQVTRVGQHLALVIFHIVDENGHADASVRDLERITGWGRQTIADHLGEIKVFMSVVLGMGRGKSSFDLQCKITRAVNELRSVRQLDAIERKEHPVSAPKVREWVWSSTGGKCLYCKIDVPLEDFVIDHFVPKVNGGPNHISNYVPACGPCNAKKHARPALQFMANWMDTTAVKPAGNTVHVADSSVQLPDAKTVQEPDATVVSTALAILPDTKARPSRARLESSLQEDSYTLEEVSEVKEEEGGADAPSPRDAQTAFDAYNDLAQRCGLPLARTMTPERKRSIIKRMRDNGGTAAWTSLLSNVERSSFLQGENDRGWRVPGLDWLLKSANFTKVIEGTYGNGAHAAPKEGEFEKIGRLLRQATEHQQPKRSLT